jgi:hypothetical protein
MSIPECVRPHREPKREWSGPSSGGANSRSASVRGGGPSGWYTAPAGAAATRAHATARPSVGDRRKRGRDSRRGGRLQVGRRRTRAARRLPGQS